ncbi:hypothetical protein AXW83_25690 [Bosea sp. PAMC 26642]|nr:hypothetical protein AXW83_25690 [Bosea sp. PAMC 26642]
MVIQQLLAEAGTETDRKIVAVDPSGIEAAADWGSLKSAERYVGYGRAQGFISTGTVARNMPHHYRLPEILRLNEWGLSGDWTVKNEAAALNSPTGSIAYRFHARDLHLVMGRSEAGQPVKFRVRIDGQRPGGTHGADIDEDGNGTVNEQRLYQLIRQPGHITDRQFEIEFLGPSVEVFAFTFG